MKTKKLTSIEEMRGEDEDETQLLRAQLAEARKYLLGQEWCRGIKKEYFGDGVGGIVAAFPEFRVPRARRNFHRRWKCGLFE